MAGTLLLAHRGDHRRHPENSLAALRAGLALPGVAGLEFDVRTARDGVAVVIHDPTLARVQGRRERVAELPSTELAFHGVPSLSDVLAVCPADAFLDVELKEVVGEPALGPLRLARGRPDGSLDRVVVSSFDPAALASMRHLAPAIACWLNVEQALDEAVVARAVRLGCRGISADWRTIDGAAAARVHGAGLALAAWTVTRRSTLERLSRLGVAAACVEGPALPG